MIFLIIFAAIVSIVGLVITLLITKSEDVHYSSNKSLSNQLFIYCILIPLIIIVIIIAILIT